MRRESKIILIVCGVLAVVLFAVYYPLLSDSQPDFSRKDSEQMLGRLSNAFERKNVNDVLSFAFPDATVAGRNLKAINDMLVKGFAQTRDLQVRFDNVDYQREGDKVLVGAKVSAGERSQGASGTDYYSQSIRFTLRRRATPLVFGLLHRYEWKITDVDAPNLPSAEGL